MWWTAINVTVNCGVVTGRVHMLSRSQQRIWSIMQEVVTVNEKVRLECWNAVLIACDIGFRYYYTINGYYTPIVYATIRRGKKRNSTLQTMWNWIQKV